MRTTKDKTLVLVMLQTTQHLSFNRYSHLYALHKLIQPMKNKQMVCNNLNTSVHNYQNISQLMAKAKGKLHSKVMLKKNL